MWLLGGFGTAEGMAVEHPAHRHTVLDWTRRNLASDLPDTANLWLDPDAGDESFRATRDVQWWRRSTRALSAALTTEIGADAAQRCLAERLFVLEAFPYPAQHRPTRVQLATANYTRYLLRRWRESGRLIVIGRAEALWRQLDPGIDDALAQAQALRVRNVQSATISPTNLISGADGFARIVTALTAKSAS